MIIACLKIDTVSRDYQIFTEFVPKRESKGWLLQQKRDRNNLKSDVSRFINTHISRNSFSTLQESAIEQTLPLNYSNPSNSSVYGKTLVRNWAMSPVSFGMSRNGWGLYIRKHFVCRKWGKQRIMFIFWTILTRHYNGKPTQMIWLLLWIVSVTLIISV